MKEVFTNKWIITTIVVSVLSMVAVGVNSHYSSPTPTPKKIEKVHPAPIKKSDNTVDPKSLYPAVVWLKSSNGSFGSGSIISPEGHILTAAHVADLFKRVPANVITGDGKKYTAKVVKVSTKCDLAIFKIVEQGTFPYISFANKPVKVGDPLTIIGYSGGQLRSKHVTYLRTEQAQTGWGLDDMLMSPGIAPGDSGGPIVNSAGLQVGVGVAVNVNSKESIGVSIGQCRDLMK